MCNFHLQAASQVVSAMSRRPSRTDAATAFLAAAVVVGAGWFCLAAQPVTTLPRGKISNNSEVESSYNEYLRAWKDKDYAALNRILSDDYRAVNFKGIVSTKENEIATAKEDRTYDALTGEVFSCGIWRKCNCVWADTRQLERWTRNSATSHFSFFGNAAEAARGMEACGNAIHPI